MKPPVSFGNSKLTGRVIIQNMNSAADCPTDALGMCLLGPKHGDGSCYAWRNAERFRPSVLAYRRRQEEWWTNHFDPQQVVDAVNKKRKKPHYFRYSEAGDFREQEDVHKMIEMCVRLNAEGLICYGYSRRTDLDLTHLSKVSNIVLGGDEVLEGYGHSIIVPKNAEKAPEGYTMCPGKDCLSKCTLCAKGCKKVAFHKH